MPWSWYVTLMYSATATAACLVVGVADRAELGEQAGGGGGGDEVALLPFEHRRQQRSGRPDVGHDVDAPQAVPVLVGDLGAAGRAGDAGVGDEDVDRAVRRLGESDQPADVLLVPDVHPDRQRADLAPGLLARPPGRGRRP